MKPIMQRGSVSVMSLFLCGSLVFIGLFHEYLACVASLFLLVYLAVVICRQGALYIRKNLTGLFALVLVLGYGISCLWAVDSGMAFIGFLKFLPVLLFWLLLVQQSDGPELMLDILPMIATAMTVIAAVGMHIPFSSSFFSVSGRLAGFFQYPNTFAALLLIAELIVIMRDKHRWYDYVQLAVLACGILYTGSRTVFLLAVAANIAALFMSKNNHSRWIVPLTAAVGVAAIGLYMLISGDTALLDRLLSISWKESTFVGRLLYYRDALPVIAAHPFGLGYMGYFFLQQSFQTGVYSVRYIHNDFLQVLLDVGWIPFVAMVAAVVATLINKRVPIKNKLLLAVLVLHSCFDFDLQFIGMFFVLILLLDPQRGDEKVLNISGRRIAAAGLCGVMAAGCVYMGVAQALSRFGQAEAADVMYPCSTQNDLTLLAKKTSIDTALPIAQEILARNEHVVAAHKITARYAYSRGDFARLIEIKRHILEMAPFAYEEYEEYATMLINGIALYSQAGDEYSVSVCQKELVWLRRQLRSVNSKLSELGKMVKDQPTTRLPEEIDRYIQGVTPDE